MKQTDTRRSRTHQVFWKRRSKMWDFGWEGGAAVPRVFGPEVTASTAEENLLLLLLLQALQAGARFQRYPLTVTQGEPKTRNATTRAVNTKKTEGVDKLGKTSPQTSCCERKFGRTGSHCVRHELRLWFGQTGGAFFRLEQGVQSNEEHILSCWRQKRNFCLLCLVLESQWHRMTNNP